MQRLVLFLNDQTIVNQDPNLRLNLYFIWRFTKVGTYLLHWVGISSIQLFVHITAVKNESMNNCISKVSNNIL